MSTAAKASGLRYTIAVAGATGNLGAEMTSVLLAEYSTVFTRVLALSRNSGSDKARALAVQGAQLRQISPDNPLPDFTRALEGVDVLIDVLQPEPDAFRDALFQAAAKQGVRVCILSEFGADRRTGYWGWAHPDWQKKTANDARARKIVKGSGMKVIEPYIGSIMELCFSHFLGFDHANNTYTIIGSPSQRISWTSKRDIDRAMAELALLALDPATAASVPDHARIAGNTLSVEEAARTVERAKGDGSHVNIVSKDLESIKQAHQTSLKGDKPDFMTSVLLALGESQVDVSEGNLNELVNPGQAIFKWTTIEDYARQEKL